MVTNQYYLHTNFRARVHMKVLREGAFNPNYHRNEPYAFCAWASDGPRIHGLPAYCESDMRRVGRVFAEIYNRDFTLDDFMQCADNTLKQWLGVIKQ